MAESVASLVIGTALAMVGLFLLSLGVTFLPIFGIVVACPVIALSFFVFREAKWEIVTREQRKPL